MSRPRDFTVILPDGSKHPVQGKFAGILQRGDDAAPMIEEPKGKYVIVDPRAVILDGNGLVYHPRQAPRPLAPNILAWLLQHPEWPDEGPARTVFQ